MESYESVDTTQEPAVSKRGISKVRKITFEMPPIEQLIVVFLSREKD